MMPSRVVLALWALLGATVTCLAVHASSAPGKNPIVRFWGTEAGLPQITVNSIVQIRDGYLWVATQDGLARFDGVRFTVFGLADGLSTVEISTPNLAPPAAWVALATNAADTDGVFSFTDSQAASFPQRFYRLHTP